MIYEYVRTTTIRGSKVRKILKMLKTYEVVFGDPHFPLSDLPENENSYKQDLELRLYSMKDVVQNIKLFIKETYNRDFYKKSEFKKKAFAGAKMVSVLNYIDFQIIRANNNLNYLNDGNLITSSQNSLCFKIFWEQQLESLNLIKKLILSQYLTLRDEENNFIYEFLINVEEED